MCGLNMILNALMLLKAYSLLDIKWHKTGYEDFVVIVLVMANGPKNYCLLKCIHVNLICCYEA